MLDSAVASPMNVNHYEKLDDVFHLAGNLAEKSIKNHSYQDGNKRTALLAADMFLKFNGLKLQRRPKIPGTVHETVEAQVTVAMSNWDAKRLGEYYQSISTPSRWLSDGAIDDLTSHHSEIGKLARSCSQGISAPREIELWMGGLENAYVMNEPEING